MLECSIAQGYKILMKLFNLKFKKISFLEHFNSNKSDEKTTQVGQKTYSQRESSDSPGDFRFRKTKRFN